ncbi:MAG: hypothetical protein Ct9H90mP15_00420 [Candidatus Neomarinimicrobiota bacterium]|jgi:hypothetical protein|nr:MAG: hypothetical protein Ct9H90mP15_00420 [Candidatus Neomarinimicrobiota bacterium]
MTEESYTEKQLFDMLISQSVYGVWIALGKMKNPVTDKTEVDLRSASIQIDMLEMINNRMSASLDENETKYLDQVLSELKMNFVDEQNKEKNSDDNSKDKE